MLIVGAKGLAKEVLEIYYQRNEHRKIFFYDDISKNVPGRLFEQFPVLNTCSEVQELYKNDKRFIVAVGDSGRRKKLFEQFTAWGGTYVSAISPFAQIGHFGTKVGDGCIIMAGAVITNSVEVGRGCLINPNCVISHDSRLNEFVDVSPGVKITGYCTIGTCSNIGTGAILLPHIQVGDNAIIGAGAVVTKNVGSGKTVVGIPAKELMKPKVKKSLSENFKELE